MSNEFIHKNKIRCEGDEVRDDAVPLENPSFSECGEGVL